MENELESLASYNYHKLKHYEQSEEELLRTGVACPVCKDKELLLADDMILNSYPPKRRVTCTECGYSNYLIV